MVRDGRARYGPFGGLRVERVTKDDGRYVLYYTWPADGRPAAIRDADERKTKGRDGPPKHAARDDSDV